VIGSFAPVLFGFISHRWGVRGFEVAFAALGPLLVAAAAMMALLTWIAGKKELHWLEDFSLALSMLFGMACAVLIRLWM